MTNLIYEVVLINKPEFGGQTFTYEKVNELKLEADFVKMKFLDGSEQWENSYRIASVKKINVRPEN